jgi:hypothetical protein
MFSCIFITCVLLAQLTITSYSSFHLDDEDSGSIRVKRSDLLVNIIAVSVFSKRVQPNP